MLMFLPPTYHLMLRLHVRPMSTLVRIATDYWPTMFHIDEYLEGLVQVAAVDDV